MNKNHVKSISIGLISLAGLSLGSPAFATSSLQKACKADLAKHGCSVKSDAEAHECLEKNEKHSEKHDGFSVACYEAHEAYEKTAGKMENGEKGESESEKK